MSFDKQFSDIELVQTLADNDEPRRSEQREAILRYLASRPNAADTLEGIVNWWLPTQRYRDTYEAIEQILEELDAEGVLKKSGLPDNKVIYTCTPKKIQ